MREKHITNLLDARLAELSAADHARIETHAAKCAACHQAYEAAQVSGQLLRARAAATVEAPPFFQTRVMAAIRERQLTPEPFAFGRMWQAARSLVGALALAVVILAGATFFVDRPATPGETVTAFADTSDQVLLGDALAPEEVTYGQTLSAIYAAEEETGEDDGNQ